MSKMPKQVETLNFTQAIIVVVLKIRKSGLINWMNVCQKCPKTLLLSDAADHQRCASR